MTVKHKHVSMEDYNCVLVWLLLTFLGLKAAAVTVEVGSDVTLECPLSGDFPTWFGPPPDIIALTSTNAVTTNGMEYVNDKDLRILNVMTSQAGVYTCKTGSGEATAELVVNSFDYKVKFLNEHDLRSQSNMIDSDYDMFIAAWDGRDSSSRPADAPRKGTDLTVTCMVENAFPEPHVVIQFLDETGLKITDTISSSDLQADNTYTVTAYINVTFSRRLNEREVACVASSGKKSVRKQSRVRIVYPPSGDGSKRIGLFDERHGSGSFGCSTDYSWPKVDIRWSINGSEYRQVPGFLPNPVRMPCQRLQASGRPWFHCESDQHFENLTRTYNGMDVSCVYYFLGQYLSHKNFTLHISFPPASVSLPGPVKAVSGQNATLACTASLAAYGTSTSGVDFRWTLNGENMDSTQVSYVLEPGQYDGFITTQTVTLPVTRYMDGAVVECRANNMAGYTFDPRDSTTLDIQYAPVIVRPYQNVIHGYKGLGLNMICVVNSKPVSNLTWYSVYEKAQEPLFLESRSVEENKLSAYLTYHYRMPGAFYRCVADNGIEPVATKDIKVILEDKPTDPVIEITSVKADSMIVTVNESHAPLKVPRLLHVQYKPDGAPDYAWVEAGYGTLATDIDHTSLYPNAVYIHNLLPGTIYSIRLRIEDVGFSYYSEKTKRMRTAGEEMKSQSEYRNAILISVLVTFGVMVVILSVAIVMVKQGKCGGTKRSDMYAM